MLCASACLFIVFFSYCLSFLPNLVFSQANEGDVSRRLLAILTLASSVVCAVYSNLQAEDWELSYFCHLGFVAALLGQSIYRVQRHLDSRVMAESLCCP